MLLNLYLGMTHITQILTMVEFSKLGLPTSCARAQVDITLRNNVIHVSGGEYNVPYSCSSNRVMHIPLKFSVVLCQKSFQIYLVAAVHSVFRRALHVFFYRKKTSTLVLIGCLTCSMFDASVNVMF